MTLPKGSVVSTGTVSRPFTSTATTATITARYLDAELNTRTVVTSPR